MYSEQRNHHFLQYCFILNNTSRLSLAAFYLILILLRKLLSLVFLIWRRNIYILSDKSFLNFVLKSLYFPNSISSILQRCSILIKYRKYLILVHIQFFFKPWEHFFSTKKSTRKIVLSTCGRWCRTVFSTSLEI